MKRDIPFFNYKALYERDKKELLPVIEDVLNRGAYVMQADLFDFEERLAEFVGVKHAVGVADGTIAIMMGLRAAGVGSGDEVILPSHTFVATAAAVRHVGGTPVLADCGEDHLIDPNDIESRITARTKVIMPVQLNGRTANMREIVGIANKYGLKIVEDSAQALGSKYDKKSAGSFGLAGTCSFYPSKTLGCFGDGGAVLTNDSEAANFFRVLRDHGRSSDGEIIDWGYNSRLDNLQAAILGFKLKRYSFEIERRREIAQIYDSSLRCISDLLLPTPPSESSLNYDIYQNYEVESSKRDLLRQHLINNGVNTIIQWGGKTLHQFKNLGLNKDVPRTEQLTKGFFLLPMNTSLSDEDIMYICDCVHSFFDNN